MKSIEFYSFDVKAILTKNVAGNIVWKQPEENKYDDTKSFLWLWWMQINVQNGFRLSQYIFELDESKASGKRKVWLTSQI